MNNVVNNLKKILNIKNDVELGQLLGYSKGSFSVFKARGQIGTLLQRVLEVSPQVSLDACISASHPHLYQLAKQATDTAIATNTTDELESILKTFYYQKTIENAISSVLFSQKQMPFFSKIVEFLNGDKAAIIKLFRLILNELQSQEIEPQKNAKKTLIEAIKKTSKFKANELSFFFQKDIDGLLKVIEELDERVCESILTDLPAVISALESVKTSG